MSVVHVDTQELPLTPSALSGSRRSVTSISSIRAPIVGRAALMEARREELRRRYVLSVASLGALGALLGLTVLVLDMVR